MKTTGIVLVVLGGLMLMALPTKMSVAPEQVSMSFGTAISLCGIGAYLIHRANQKKEEQEKKDKWNK